MKFDVYAIKDLEKGDFAQPFFVPEGNPIEHIKINFKRLIEKGDSEVSYFPDRFELWHLGIFDSFVASTLEDAHPIFDCRVDNVFLVCKGQDYARPEYLQALAKAKAEMEDNGENID